jgi:hypothetical protein
MELGIISLSDVTADRTRAGRSPPSTGSTPRSPTRAPTDKLGLDVFALGEHLPRRR